MIELQNQEHRDGKAHTIHPQTTNKTHHTTTAIATLTMQTKEH
jgi:hypothetical protein